VTGAGGRAPSSPDPLVRMERIRKAFGSVVALDGADLDVRPGEVHAVLGENGAGKTTLLSVLSGFLRPDGGRVAVDGATVRFRTPREAWRLGIGMVHQHFTLVPRLTVLENLVLGTRSRGGGLGLPLDDYRERAGRIAERTGLAVALDEPVEGLGVGHRQRVEILKILLRDPRVLVLDEPTAVLAPAEVDGLLALLRSLAGEGRAVVLVAHKLDEVLAVAGRVTVLRNGRTVLRAPRSEVDGPALARAMVGREVDVVRREAAPAARPASPAAPTDVVARLESVSVDDPPGTPRLRDVSLTVRRGEIVGVAGVEGNGQRELARVLARRLEPGAGRAELPDDPGFIPQDRRGEGLIADLSVSENVALALHRDPSCRQGPFLRWREVARRARDAMRRYGVRAPDASTPAGALSGGNQQRLVVARELALSRELLVAENPTRGLDVAGEAFVHRQLLALRDADPAPGVVLVSTDLDEVLRLADRVLVMVRGRLLDVPEGERTRQGIGARMLSGREDA